MKTEYAGIDYGGGTTNISPAGIRYGVIPMNEVVQAWAEESEPLYVYTCPYCGTLLINNDATEKCPGCSKKINPETDFETLEPDRYVYTKDGYKAESDDNGDIFITESPYYTYAQFCSPCAPGACYLPSEIEPREGNKCYCFGHDWFEDNKAPYTVYSIADNTIINA